MLGGRNVVGQAVASLLVEVGSWKMLEGNMRQYVINVLTHGYSINSNRRFATDEVGVTRRNDGLDEAYPRL